MQIGKKNVSRQKSVGFPAIFKKNILCTSCGYELLVMSCRGHEMLVYPLLNFLFIPYRSTSHLTHNSSRGNDVTHSSAVFII